MIEPLSAEERQAMMAKYFLAHGQNVEVLDDTVAVEQTNGRVSFTVNDPVRFESFDAWSRKPTRQYRGLVVIFLRMTEPFLGQRSYGIVLVEGEHGERQQHRVGLNDLHHDSSPNS